MKDTPQEDCGGDEVAAQSVEEETTDRQENEEETEVAEEEERDLSQDKEASDGSKTTIAKSKVFSRNEVWNSMALLWLIFFLCC